MILQPQKAVFYIHPLFNLVLHQRDVAVHNCYLAIKELRILSLSSSIEEIYCHSLIGNATFQINLYASREQISLMPV